MKRHVAFLRGVSPMNCKMPQLAQTFEAAGFQDVRTLLSSGNVAFNATGAESTIRKKADAAMREYMGKTFALFIRPAEDLQALLAADVFGRFKLPPGAKRVVTFLPTAPTTVPKLPISLEEARILAVDGREVFSVYVPGPKGPVFMTLIEKTFGKDVTTRTWDTVRKAAAA